MLDRFQPFSTNHQMMVLMKHCCMAWTIIWWAPEKLGLQPNGPPSEAYSIFYIIMSVSENGVFPIYDTCIHIRSYTYILMVTIMTDPGSLRGPIFWATHGHQRPPHLRLTCNRRLCAWVDPDMCGSSAAEFTHGEFVVQKNNFWSILRGRHGI